MERSARADHVPEPGVPRESLYGLAWILLFCAITQAPYALVWVGKSTFVYDAFTIFSPWHIAQLNSLRSGSGLFSVFQDNLSTDVWPSYFYYGVLRQFAALIQPNTATAHAVVQAIHITLLVPAVALLFRSMGVPVRFGALGGLVFSLSGIHVSLTQHVLGCEALLYLVLALWGLRDLLLNWHARRAWENVFWFAATGIILVSLVRVHHEAILYVVPLAIWTSFHLVAVWRSVGFPAFAASTLMVVGLAVFIAVCSVPMLLTAYEMSLINKTLVHSYDQLGPYFHDSRVLLFALILPRFTGSAGTLSPEVFGFGQDSTLAYLFAGTLTVPMFTTVVVVWVREARWRQAAGLVAVAGLLVGFAMGGGNPVHRLLCAVFPFLTGIGHSYYGLHLLYLVGAFAVAEGARILSIGRYVVQFVLIAALICILVTDFVPNVPLPVRWGFIGDPLAFAAAEHADLRWMWNITAIAMALVAIWHWIRKLRPGMNEAVLNTAFFLLLSAVVSVDHLRPVLGAHFVPNRSWVSWLSDPLGGFNPSRSIVEYFKGQTNPGAPSVKVLPLFPQGGGWQVNSLIPLNVHLMSAPADSGGNRFIAAALEREPNADAIPTLIDDYGIEYFWVARWQMENWAAALRTSDAVDLVFSAEYAGDVYRTRKEYLERVRIVGDTIHLPWRGAADTVDRGVVSREWRFAMPADRPDRPMNVQLPLMWHAAFAVSLPDGTNVPYTQDDKGRVLIEQFNRPAASIVVAYPNRWLSTLVGISSWLYVSMVVVAFISAVGAFGLRRRTRFQTD